MIACTRKGLVDHLKEKNSDSGMNDCSDKADWIQGFPNGCKRNHDVGATSSGMKRHKHDHHHKESHRHHHKRSNGSHNKSEQKRFCRTASALKQAGLLELTLQTAQLIQENENLQKEIDSLQHQTLEFSKSLQVQLEEKVSKEKSQNGFS